MTVGPPPCRRLPRRRGGLDVEALREQALIEEARRRARQRRLGYLAVLALGLAVLAQAGFGPRGRGRSGADAPRSVLLAATADSNGKLAIADDTGSLTLVNPDGSGLRTLSRCTGNVLLSNCRAVEPAWSPDGMRLAFVRGHFGLRHVAMALYVTEPNTNRPRLLAHCGTCGSQDSARGISWSPDGTRIVFSATGSRPAELSLFTVDTDSGTVRRLTDCDPSSCADAAPDWSPDGQLIVFTRIDRSTMSLYTVRPDGSGLTAVKSEPEAADPRWSPDGRLIAYDARDSSHDLVYVVAADGSRPSRLLASGSKGTGPHVPAWSPDGNRLVYFSTPPLAGAFGSEVWTVSADGTQRRRLSRFGCCVDEWAPPVWSPDGKQIAFSANYQDLTVARDGTISSRPNGGTFVVNADGSGRNRLTRKLAGALSWQSVH